LAAHQGLGFGGLGFVGLLKAGVASVALALLSTGNATAAGLAPNALPTTALPTGAVVNTGKLAISTQGAAMTIQQTTDKASVNWNAFNIGSGASVNVQQNSVNSVLLNRVVGNDPSQILGKLTANGQVVLVNPNGIVFGKDGSVAAGAFTASTFGISEQDFANGKYNYTRNGSTAAVTVENGASLSATAHGGYVALIGASVDNQGTISTQGGSVLMVAGEKAALPEAMTSNVSVPLSGKVRLELLPSTINTMVSNSGTITTEGGQVLMQAAALSDAVASITHTETIDTTGTKGGAVTLQADHGIIKATGTIKASSKNAKNKGGDIYIGRDEETGVLARATDVSGAKLESKGGFVETSGDHLKTDGISVKAKDWLLDPTDIKIVAVGTATPDTATVPGSGLYQDTTALSTSEVLTSTIKTAIDNGTNVTISTANSVVGANGSGNIVIFDKLDFANNSGQDVTLTLLAKNGITQNTGAFIKQTAGANDNKVNVVMTSEGLHGGNSAPSTSSKGITLNAAISTNGDVTLNGTTNNSAAASASNAVGVDIKSTAAITAKNISVTGKSESSFGIQSASALYATDKITLDGTSTNWVGVVTNAAVTAGGTLTIIGHKTSAAGYQGININRAVKGASVAITGDSVGHYGVGIGTLGSVESTTGDVTISGTGTGNTTMGGNNNAVGVQVRGDVTAKGKLSITGTKNGSGGYQGVTFSDSKTMRGDSIEITGTSNAWDAVTFTNATFAATKTLKITADSTAVGHGVLFSGGSTNTFTADSYLVTAKTAVKNGIYFSGTNTFNSTSATTDSLIDVTRTTAGSDTIFNAGTLTINSGAGKAALQTSTSNVGGGIRINGGSTVNTTGDVTIGSKNSGNAYTFNQGTINAQGNLKLLGQSTGDGIYMQDSGGKGSKIVGTNGANISLDGTSSGSGAGVNLSVNNSANSITTTGTSSTGAVGNISITGTSASGHGISNAATEVKNTSTNSITGGKGNITLTGITLAGLGQGIYNMAAMANAGLNAIYAAGDLTLKGNSVNGNAVNTSGTLEAGGLLKIEGTAVPSIPVFDAKSIGIYVGNTVKGGTVLMTGTTGGSKGININGAVTSTVGDITLTGVGGGNYYYGQGVLTEVAGSLNSAAGITVKGTSTARDNLTTIGTQIQGTVAAVSDILVEGKNTAITSKAGLSIESSIKSTGGNITVTAENTSGTAPALFVTAAGKLQTDSDLKAITINTNGLDLNAAATVQAGSTGVGTVNIKTVGLTNNILVGGSDMHSNSPAGQTLGLTNEELNQITAGNLVIGNTSGAGNITVSNAITTKATTGNVTLQTSGNISVNAALTVGDAGATKNLTLIGAGVGAKASAISQTAAIKTAGLELLGTNATHTLNNIDNSIAKLASNTGTISLTNTGDLEVSTVNTNGVTATGNVLITTKPGSTPGNLTLKKNITAANLDLNTAASVLRDTTVLTDGIINASLLRIKAGSSIGTSASRIKTDVATLSMESMADQYITEASAVTVAAKSTNGSVNIDAATGALTVGSSTLMNGNTINGISAALGVNITAQAGDLNINQSINNAISGDVVLGAGVSKLKGDGTGGDVKTTSGKSVTTFTEGKTYIYTGAIASTGKLTDSFSSSLGALYLSTIGSNLANTSSKTGYNLTPTPISGGNSTQVFFREIIDVGTVGLGASNFTKTYGDIDQSYATGSLTSDLRSFIKTNNSTGGTSNTFNRTGVNGAASNIYITASDLIDSLNITKSYTTTDFSTSANLRANTSGYMYAMGQGSVYKVTLDSGSLAKVVVNQKTLTVSGITASDKTYTGDAVAALVVTGLVKGGLVSKDDVTVSATGTFRNDANTADDKNVKLLGGVVQAKTVALSSSYGGADKDNYAITNQTSTTASITAKELTFAAVTDTKLYDGGTGSSKSATVNGIQTGDAITATQSFANKNVLGTDGSSLQVGAVTIRDGNNGNNYTIGNKTTTAGSIFKKSITLDGITAANKTYDGTNAAIITAGAIATGIANETLAVSGTGTFSDKNAADGKTVTVADVTTLAKTNGTGEWRNYNLTSTGSITTTANIDKKNVTLDSITAANKVYDGTDTATITAGSITTGVGNETLAISGKGKFADTAPGTNKVVTVADVTTLTKTNGTGDWNNYKLNSTGSKTTKATITAVPPSPPAPTPSPASTSSGSGAPRVKIPLGSSNPFQLASVEMMVDEVCSASNLESCFCEPSPLSKEVSICYEKKQR
jgi:filamentous hemagglutinin family protein